MSLTPINLVSVAKVASETLRFPSIEEKTGAPGPKIDNKLKFVSEVGLLAK